VGLVKPSARSDGGFRLYTEADVERILLVRRMKPLGFSLEQMAQVLRIVDAAESGGSAGDGAAPGVGEDADVDVSEFIDQARTRREKLAGQVVAADELIAHLERVRDRIVRGTR
jgi:MerR family copper efflux transcriptional regulator